MSAPEVSTTPEDVPTADDAAWLLEQLDADERDRCPDCERGRLKVTGPPCRETGTTPVRCTWCGLEDY